MIPEELRKYATEILLRELKPNQWAALAYLVKEGFPNNYHQKRGLIERLKTQKWGKQNALSKDPVYYLTSN